MPNFNMVGNSGDMLRNTALSQALLDAIRRAVAARNSTTAGGWPSGQTEAGRAAAPVTPRVTPFPSLQPGRQVMPALGPQPNNWIAGNSADHQIINPLQALTGGYVPKYGYGSMYGGMGAGAPYGQGGGTGTSWLEQILAMLQSLGGQG